MLRIKTLLISFACAVAVAAAGFATANPITVVQTGKPALQYLCKDQQKLVVNYYELSDHSLQFVKINFGTNEVTLPAVLSGSGARYSDGYRFEWWIKGNNATLKTNPDTKDQKEVECLTQE